MPLLASNRSFIAIRHIWIEKSGLTIMVSSRRRGPIAVLAAPGVGLGILKLYLHLTSVWKFGFLDYLVAAGLVFGGFFLFLAVDKLVLGISGFLLTFEFYKLFLDYRDHFDVFIVSISFLYLIVPFLRFFHSRSRSWGFAILTTWSQALGWN